MRLVFRVSVAQRFLLERSIKNCVSRLLQLSYRPVSAFQLRRPFDLSFSWICLFKSVLLGAVSSEPQSGEINDCVDPAGFRGSVSR